MPGLTLGNSNIGNTSACLYPVTCFTGNVLVLAGGGGGSTLYGGGAGGMLECTSTLFLNVNYNISVGGGGATLAPGSNSYFCINSSSICPLYNFNIETCGGGAGGCSGGSGGGFQSPANTTAVPGQGFAGSSSPLNAKGAGGGAGSSPPPANLFIGGGGRATQLINGNDYCLGGGGGGGYSPTVAYGLNPTARGGCGGGGSGGSAYRTNALPNSGSGGGGGYPANPSTNPSTPVGPGTLGGSGVVIVGWCTSQNINYCVSPSLTYCPTGRPNWTGVSILSGAGTICFYKIPECIYPVDVLVVGGGGSGGSGLINSTLGGGGGAGGVILGSSQLKLHDRICISVGGGGSGSVPGSNGTGSCFGNFCALGGGRYGCCGASAGGASRTFTPSPTLSITGTNGILNTCTFPIQGCRGGSGVGASSAHPGAYSGAGGGANQSASLLSLSPGPPTATTPFAYIGGNGCLLNITGIATYYGGGGGGWTQSGGAQPGGLGGGGTNSAGTTNTGGGGSSRSSPSTAVWGGGSGIVVVAYANTIPDSLFTGLTLNPVVNPSGAANTTNRPGYKVYEITGGTGTMQLGN